MSRIAYGTLGYERVKTFAFYPVENYWRAVEAAQSEPCQEPWHKLDGGSRCIRVWMRWDSPVGGHGRWRLKNPISIRGECPGSNHRITSLRLKTLAQVDNGLYWAFYRRISILADNVEVWKAEGDQIPLIRDKESFVAFSPNTDVSLHNYVDIELDVYAYYLVGGFIAAHYFDIEMDISYFTEEPPQTGVVEVYVTNAETGRPVGGATVEILSGEQVIAGGRTDMSGKATFPNVEAEANGSNYVLRVTASGYYERRMGITVKPNVTNRFEVTLDPKPFSWEDLTLTQWILIGGAVIVIGGVAMAAMGRAAGRERIMVVK